MYFAPIHLHLHASFEPTGSMGGHMARAKALGIRHLWFTEHDVRLGPREYDIPSFSFVGDALTAEDAPGHTCGFVPMEGVAVDRGQVTDVSGKNARLLALTPESTAGKDGFTGGGLSFYSDGKRHCAGLLSGVTVSVCARCHAEDWENARVIFDFTLSQQPPHFEPVHLLYVLGNPAGLEDEKTQVIPLSLAQDGEYTFPLSQDCAERIGGLDNAFCTVSVRLEGKNGAEAKAVLSRVDFSTRYRFEETRRRMQALVTQLEEKHGVRGFVGTEISGAGQHKNCFGSTVPIIPYDTLHYAVTHEEACRYVTEHGGIFAFNHPFTPWKRDKLSDAQKWEAVEKRAEELIEHDAYGADLIEVGFPYAKQDFTAPYYFRLWDRLSANGVVLTGYGDSDNHSNDENGWLTKNNFVAFVEVDNDRKDEKGFYAEADFLKGLHLGRLYSKDPTVPGELSFATADGYPSGTVIRDELPACVVFFLSQPLAGTVVRRIVDGEETLTAQMGQEPFEDRFLLPTDGKIHFVRYEVISAQGRLMMFTNPIFRIPASLPLRKTAQDRAVDRTKDCRLFIARHGQVLSDAYYGGDVDFPKGNPDLTPLGKAQAQDLAGYMKSQGFHGIIYASPYRRTMETAEAVAEATQCPIRILPCIRERMKEAGEVGADNPEQLEKRYPHCAGISLSEPIPTDSPQETYADVLSRVTQGVAQLSLKGDVLFVGHGSSVAALMESLRIPFTSDVRWNGSLALRDGADGRVRPFLYDYIPEERLTSNALVMTEERERRQEYPLPYGEKLSVKGQYKVLHIGDTLTMNYTYYRQLIATVKPDLILHTGDVADECKAGRIETDRAQYPAIIKPFIEMLLSFGIPVWIVPGNNDVAEVLASYEPAVRLLKPDTVVTLGGVRCCVAHRLWDCRQEADAYLYGHGYSGDPHVFGDNARGGKQYYNACNQSFVHFFGENKCYPLYDPTY